MAGKRRLCGPAFKAKVALAAAKGDRCALAGVPVPHEPKRHGACSQDGDAGRSRR